MINAELLLMTEYMRRVVEECPSDYGLWDDDCKLLYDSNEAKSCRQCWKQAIDLELKQTNKGDL